jgi:hypothetical protein
MFGRFMEAGAFCKDKLAGKTKTRMPHPNFITLHCTSMSDQRRQEMVVKHRVDLYVILTTIVGSVVLYGGKNMAFVDALFFATGGSTQSGLNP